MDRYYKKSLIVLFMVFSVGCSTSLPWEHPNMSLFELQQLDAENELNEPLNPEEMHLWVPPSDSELAMRRIRQEKLQEVAMSVDDLILNFRGLQEEGSLLENSVTTANARLDAINGKIINAGRQNEKLYQDTEKIKSSVNIAKSKVRKIKKSKKIRPTQPQYNNYYKNAIISFRKGNYEGSILFFEKSLTVSQPRSLLDNIQFGLGSAYYKLKDYPSSIKHFDNILKNYPGQDKWLDAHVLLGLVYGLDGQKSKSISIIEKALNNNPSPQVRKILDQLIAITQDESLYAVS